MIKYIAFITCLLFYTTAYTEVVNKLNISGNKRINVETIKVYGDIEIGKDYQKSDLNKILKNLYSTNFFEDVQLELKNNILSLNVKEFPVINQLILIGEPSNKYKDQIRKLIKLKEKNSFIFSYLSSDIEIIKKLYSSAGYNNSKVEIKTKQIDENNLDMIIDIDRGNVTKISSINFIGDKKVRDKRLRDIIASEEAKFWKLITRNTRFSENLINLDIRLLNNYYKSLGYYDVEITSNTAELDQEGNINLIYSIDSGKRYTITKISTNADKVFDTKIFFPMQKFYKKHIGEYYSPFKITNLLENLDELIDNNSLQFVEHNVEEIVDSEKAEIEIKFNIFESEKVTVERINVLGNNVTNESVIRGELLIDEGDPFTKTRLDKSIAKLKARRIFASVTPKVTEGSEKNLKLIDIEVEERPTGEISAGAGVGTNGGSFAFNVSENNWLGEGKKLNFELEADKESLSGLISYTDSNYDFLGNSLNYYFGSTSNDKPTQGYENTTISAEVNTSFEQYKDFFATLGLAMTYDDLRTDGTASDSLKKQEGEFSEIAAIYGFKHDKRNRAFMPTSGSIVSFNQVLPFYADKNFISNSFSASVYKAFSENFVGATKVYLSAINGIGGDDVRISKRKGLSTKRLRGFERGKVGPVDGDDHIGGNYASAINLEASLPNLFPEDTKTDVNLFLDFGNVWGVDYDSSLDDSSKIRSSAGVAANWSSPLGPMTFILSTNLAKANTDKTESFSFNLGTTF